MKIEKNVFFFRKIYDSAENSVEESGQKKIKIEPLNPMVFYPRFKHIVEKIFANLDSKSLSNCREIAKSWQECIDNKNLLWLAIVNKIGSNEAFQRACKTGHLKLFVMLFQKNKGMCGRLFQIIHTDIRSLDQIFFYIVHSGLEMGLSFLKSNPRNL